MQQNNKFNSYIKNKIELFESPMDLDKGWSRFQAKKREKRKKEKRGIILLFTSFITIVSLSSIFHFKQNGNISNINAKNENITNANTYTENAKIARNTRKSLDKKQTLLGYNAHRSNIIFGIMDTKSIVIQQESKKKEHLPLSSIKRDRIQEICILPKLFPVIAIPKQSEFNGNLYNKVEKSAKNRHFCWLFGLGSSYYKQTHNTELDKFADIKDFRNREEKNIQTISYKVGLQYFLRKNTFINMSLNYDDWYSKFKISQTRLKEYKFTNVVVRTITYQPSGKVESIYGDTIVNGKQTINGTLFQRHKSLALELGIGKTFNYKRVCLYPSIGTSYCFYNKVNGKVIDNLSSLIFKETNSIYKDSFWAINSNVGIAYKINKNFALSLNIYSNHSITNISNSEYKLKTRVSSNGISIGVNYHISK